MRIVFFGTAEFAVPSLEQLIKAGHTVVAVVTQPDKPHGRGLQLSSPPLKHAAVRLGLPVLQPKRVRSERFVEEIREIQPDLLALAAFGQIVPQALLDIPPLGPINVHGSLLPKYRGAAPIQRAILAGETVTGVTTMWMDATLDTGDILLSAELQILPSDTSGSLFPRLANLGAELLVETVERLANGTLERRPQESSQASLAPMLQPEDGAIRWHESAVQCSNRVRAVSPKPGAYAAIRGKRVKLWQAVALDEQTEETSGRILGFSKTPPGVTVAAGGQTVLILTEVQPESGKRMSADAWARGARLQPGECFTTTN